jgi:hypothetical protein
MQMGTNRLVADVATLADAVEYHESLSSLFVPGTLIMKEMNE